MVRSMRLFEDPEVAASRQSASLAALAVTLGLVVTGLYLIDVLRADAAEQDCALSGRSLCMVATAER
jgi:hypothetical protein